MSDAFCTHCGRPTSPSAHFCAHCGQLLRRPPPEVSLPPAWQRWIAEHGDPTVDPFEDAPALDPPEGFRETGWFLEAEDPEALEAVEQGDLPPLERSARHRADRVEIDEAQRRAWSLDYDDDEEDAR